MKVLTSSKWIVLVLILIQQLVHQSSFAQTAPGTHEKRSIDVEGSDDDLWYWEYLPAGYNPNDSKLYPLIIFLHGSGKRRDVTSDPAVQEQQLNRVLQEGIPYEIDNGANMCFTVNGVEKCFIVLSPQRDESGHYWPDITEDLLQYAWTHYKIDPDRIYFTGLSMGGIGTIDYIQSTRFKAADIAAAAVAPGGQAVVEGTTECDIPARDIAFWAVHGNNDTNVTYPGPMKNLISQINDCTPTPSPKAYLHLIPGVGHNVWDDFYRITSPKYSPTVYEWFLMNPKGASNTIPNQAPTVDAGPDAEVTGTSHTLFPTTLADYDGTTLADFDDIGTPGYDGSLASFEWTQVDGPTTCTLTTNTNRSLTVTNMNQDGTYTFQLKGTDHHGVPAFDLVSIVKSGGTNAPPEANAGADKNITLPDNSVTLQGSGTDSDGTIVSHSWAQHSGPSSATIVNPNSPSTSVTDLVQGTYVFRLTVTDNDNATNSDDVTVKVNTGSGDIDHAWADFFDIEGGGSVPANWNDPAVDPVLDNLGTGVDWTAVDATKPTFSGDKLIFDNAHRIDGYATTHPPVFELWVKARYTGGTGNLLSLGNQLIFGANSNGDYVCHGLTPQAGDTDEHVFRIVMDGANSKFQMDGGPEIMFDEGTSLGTKLVMGQTNSGGNSGDFEIKRFQRTAHGTLLTAQEVADKWSFHGFGVEPGGDIDHAWADFFNIEGGGSVPANWNDPAVDPVLVNLGTGDDWTAVDATKPTFSGDKLIFANAHRIDGYSTTHPPKFELWVKARYTGGHGNLLSLGNQLIFGVDGSGNYVCSGLTPQAGDATEHVFRIVMDGANSKFQMDGGPEIMFDEGTSLGTKLVMGQTNSGGNSGDFEIKRFQRTAHGTLLTAQEVSDKWAFHGFEVGGGDIDHAWADFFDIEGGRSVPANWNDPAVDPVLDNLGTGVDWTAVDATKPTFSGDKLVFANAHRIDGYSTTHPPVFELWVKARFTGEHGNLLSLGNQLVFGADSNGDYLCDGLTPQAGDANEHVFRIVMNGANSIFQMDGGPEIMFDEGTSLGTKLVMGQTNSGGNWGDFEIKRFQRTAHGTLLTAQEVSDKWLFHGFGSQQSSTMDVALSPQSSETEEPENYMIAVYDNFGGHLKSFRYSARPSEIYGLDLRSHVAQQGTYIFHIINSESKVVIKRILFVE